MNASSIHGRSAVTGVLISVLISLLNLEGVVAATDTSQEPAITANGQSKEAETNIIQEKFKQLNTYHDNVYLQEDEEYWDRVLQSIQSVPTRAPIVPPSPSPTNCPTRVEVTCPDCIPMDEDCVLFSDMVHSITNNNDEVERVYQLEAIRNGKEVDLIGLIPEGSADIQPGATLQIVERVEINQCEGEGYDTETSVITGPPCEVAVEISCISNDGDECKEIPPPDTVEECLVDVRYSYKVDNIGDVDANIITFERTRNEIYRDLMPLLASTFLEVGGSTSVQEIDGIDICSGDTYSTKVLVQQVPNADLLCEDVGFYNP
mmetsp:Transcript_14022/g.30460  ORF Transcript_14022/g.30460 Transcript_14022/m.30460 type:complete len:319 (-) Transcript_14022:125-1081(-)